MKHGTMQNGEIVEKRRRIVQNAWAGWKAKKGKRDKKKGTDGGEDLLLSAGWYVYL